ncbi:MAG TPA: hypothetical protein ENJ37_05665 [Deltaproteobacteria bacterium]|nr:hypothetical protein [Deltaproteobacteria bacterium]
MALTGRALYERRVTGIVLGIGAITLCLFGATMFFGVIMRTGQGMFIDVRPDVMYEFMTIHSIGAGGSLMVGVMAVNWYVLRKYLDLNMHIMQVMFGIIGAAVVTLLSVTLLGYYGTGWTFLYPLPFKSAGAWYDFAPGMWYLALLCVVVAMGMSWVDMVKAASRKYGFSNAMGWTLISGTVEPEKTPPPVVLISTVTAMCGLFSLAAGFIVLVLFMVHWANPDYYLDYLFVKNLIYYFGHIVMNMIMYMCAAIVYELMPLYANRPWKSNKVVAISWNTAFVAVTLAYWHHLLQDFPQPLIFQVLGVFGSYMAAFPATVVTITGTLILVYRSGLKWKAAPLYMFLGLMGWAIGGFMAVFDAGFNQYFHNTMYVPSHFHLYLLAGAAFVFVGSLYHMTWETGGAEDAFEDKLGLWAWFVGAYGVVFFFGIAGVVGTPRRYAVQMPGTEIYSKFAVYFAWIVVFGLLIAIARYLTRLQLVKPLRN